MNTASGANKKKLSNMLFTAAIIIVFAMVLVMSFSLSKTAGSVPRLISIVGIILSVISLITDSKKKDGKKEGNNADSSENQGVPFMKTFAFIIAYLVAMVVLGFLVSTILILFLMTILMNYKNYKVSAIFSVIATVMLYASFKYLFYVRLPIGILFELFL
ncbi:MAG TPA: tripartite tricarboxylate transporter TctB family protein [Clostridia bacterium]|nr:tripartite tricarboxylate transporter TctB family protein [Clostridia bacterium]